VAYGMKKNVALAILQEIKIKFN